MARIAAREKDAFYERRRGELAETALRLWAERGFAATPVAAIAEAAGVSKGTFYLYFPSKQALLEEVLRRYTLLPDVEQMVAGLDGSSFEKAVQSFVRAAWRHLSERRDLVMLLLRELPSRLGRAETDGVLERVLVPANRLIASYLEASLGPERAEEISLIVAGRGLIGMTVMVFLTQELLGAGRFLPVPEDRITETIAEIFLHGVVGARRDRPAAGSADRPDSGERGDPS